MRATAALRYSAAALGVGGLGLLAIGAVLHATEGQTNTLQNGRFAFVVADINYANSDRPREAAACPNGRSMGYREIFERSPAGQRREGESDGDYSRRAAVGAREIAQVNGQSLCMHPELGSDPHYRTMTTNITPVVGGIDLDGQNSTAKGRPAPGTCAHDDFRGLNGERGIDNQWFRVTGCIPPSQVAPGESGLTIEMLYGLRGILITLDGVDDLRNDDSVVVGIFANADPIQLSANREPLWHATYTMSQDARFRARTHGRIVNGVVTTDPVDVRLPTVLNAMHLERHLRDARMRLTLAADGALEGFMAGYTPVVDMYDMSYGFRNGRTNAGDLAPQRNGSAHGAASVLGRTCEGAWAALHRLADGHRDPATGECTSISTQYRFRAIPAFIVEAEPQPTQEH